MQDIQEIQAEQRDAVNNAGVIYSANGADPSIKQGPIRLLPSEDKKNGVNSSWTQKQEYILGWDIEEEEYRVSSIKLEHE